MAGNPQKPVTPRIKTESVLVPGKPAFPNPCRGDIYWVEADKDIRGSEQEKDRPWLVVSTNTINNQLSIVVAVPLSTKVEKIESYRVFRIRIPEQEIVTEPGEKGLSGGDRLALTEHVRSFSLIDRAKGPRVARVTPQAMGAVEAGLAFVLDIG